ncbi:MAG TPA: patatin-like phospholipase family protein [Acidimicrobiales bacterium]|nr:patatin-like phospholipase family protein [Acidimicrobiales bacterium]
MADPPADAPPPAQSEQGVSAVHPTALPGGVFPGPGAPRRRWTRSRHLNARWRRPRTAFVFAGGGARGAAQIGMLQALLERGISADDVYGASVGAINAAGFAGDPTPAGIERMAELWRQVTRDDIFPQGRIPGPWRFLQQREAVHSNEGIRRVIENGLTFERIENAAVHLEVVATSLTDGRTQWFTYGPAAEAILASAALPSLLPPVEIGRESFIDGGVVDNVPIGRAIVQGAERIFVLLCGPLRYTPHRYRRPVEAVLTAFFIAVHAKFARELERLPAGVEVIVFSVDSDPVSRYDDFSGTEALITAGRTNAEIILEFWSAGGHGSGTGRPPVSSGDELEATSGEAV